MAVDPNPVVVISAPVSGNPYMVDGADIIAGTVKIIGLVAHSD